MDRIDNVDLREALKDIAQNNTYYHLENDINVSFSQMEDALKLDDPAEKMLIWVSYPSGIDCYSERDVFQKDTRCYNGVLFHAKEMSSSRQLAYAVEVTSNSDGKLFGNLFEIDIKEYAREIEKNALISHDKSVFYVNDYGSVSQITMPKEEFERTYPLDQPKTAFHWRNEPANTNALYALLDTAQKDREANCKPCELWHYVIKLSDERITFYSNEIMHDLNKLPKPKNSDKQFFSAQLNYIVARNFDSEMLGSLLNALPYEKVEFSIKKGQRELHVVVPRDEILREEPNKQEKPSILGQIKDKAASAKPPERKDAPKKSKELEV